MNTRSLNLLPVGSFGRAVARYLQSFEPGTVITEFGNNPLPTREQCCQAEVNVIAAWRPVPRLCDYVDQISRESMRSFIPFIAEGTVFRLGPVSVPGKAGCWSCWLKRAAQHAVSPEENAAITSYYDSHPFAGPKGYLEPYAMLGAVKIKQTVDALKYSSSSAGQIWQLDALTSQAISAALMGVHNCSRCGLQREGPSRSIAEMERRLSGLWKPKADEEDCRS